MRMTSLFLVPCLLVACAASALAQQTPPDATSTSGQGLYVSALGGGAFNPHATAIFGVEFGDRVNPNVQAYATLSYFDNLMHQDLRDDLSTLSGQLTASTGTPWDLRGRDRGVGFVAGAKYLLSRNAVRPYIGGAAGLITLKRTILDARQGDVTEVVLTDYGIGENALTSTSRTRPLAEVAAGVAIHGRRAFLDLGYRYRHAFHLAKTLDFSQVTAGIGISF